MKRPYIRLLVVDNAHLYRTPDGRYYAPSLYDNTFFNRYLKVFDRVRFVAKTKYVDHVDPNRFILIDAPGLEVHELPWTQGMKALIKRLPRVVVRYRDTSVDADCAIYRVSQLESYLAFLFRDRRRPFFLEVVNDPESFVHMHAVMRWMNQVMLRVLLRRSSGAAFVTEYVLQKKYLPVELQQNPKFTLSHYSSIELHPSWIRSPRTFDALAQVKMVHVSNSIDNDIKGHRTAIAVVRRLKDQGIDAILTCIGDGSAVGALKRLSADLNVQDNVRFLGRLSNRAVLLEELSQADLFLYPTRLEGLPRAIIEAMAVGLPALSTPIAGIPELLAPEYMFDPDDVAGFAGAVARLRGNPKELTRMSYENIEMSKKFSKELLDSRRSHFYQQLRGLAQSAA